MLARLEAVPGVSAARTDSTGRFFWVEVAADADPEATAGLALDLLGKGASILSPERAARQVASHGAGDPWLRSHEVITLSLVEARLLSVRISGTVVRAAGLSPSQREELAEAVRFELFGAMERVHAEGGRGGSGWIYDEWPALAAAALARCAGTIDGEAHARVAEALPAALAR